MLAWWSKLRAVLLGRRRLRADLREEIEAHLEMEIQDEIARGVPEEQAIEILKKNSGAQFDSKVVDALITVASRRSLRPA